MECKSLSLSMSTRGGRDGPPASGVAMAVELAAHPVPSGWRYARGKLSLNGASL